ncbi:uncharacterized protein LOC100822827 [Brachypodium distachyon]|uniref:Senescence regulator n=1 Tax=Brachypodium distachyon TaxID=15368 RepID=I1GTZ2_BRADI|nr:uncharacterized protein LOC100822827 [Brachypodium distachyon]KQK15998.1 hypothetical protein BRADI_1g26260v3 [Brachypodium distachyon]|eukprot:XP_003563024.1 uncharacterized protein LOC100822827 [Brachypodium distachyon]
MAKARKPTAAERFLGFHSRPGSAAVAPSPDDLPDLAEADVWYSPYSSDSHSPTTATAADRAASRGVSPSAPRRIGGLSRAFADGRQVASSAPVAVPAWASRFAEMSLEDPPEPAAREKQQQQEEEGGADDDGWVPPHVYLARRQARASVVEGVGRTLKGRDASRVRDAVWSRTGFPG